MQKRAASPESRPSQVKDARGYAARVAPRARSAGRKTIQGLVCVAAALIYVACSADQRLSSPLRPGAGPNMEASADQDSNPDTDLAKYAPDPNPEALYPPTEGSDTTSGDAPSNDSGGPLSASASGPLLSAATGSSLVFDPDLGTNLGFSDDNCAVRPLGFTFVFFGRSFTNAGISANGQLVMNVCSTRFSGTLGFDARLRPINEVEIAPAFGDWVAQSLRGGDPASDVYFKTVGTAPNRRFVVTWNRVSAWPNYTLPLLSTFQVQLFEGSNKILFGYGDLSLAPANVVTGLSAGTGTVIRSALGLEFFGLERKNLCYVPSGNSYIAAPVSECSANRPPTANAGGNNEAKDAYSGAEGAEVTFIGSGSDPDGDDLSYAWDFNDDGRVDATTATARFTYADNGSYVGRLTVTNARGLSSSATVPVTISNVAPTVSAGDDVTIPGGTLVVVDATFTDPGANDNDWTFTIDWGDGSDAATGTVSKATAHVQGSHVYATSGVYRVTVTVADKDRDAGTASFRATVLNRPPTALAGGNNATADEYLGLEGVDVMFNGSGNDPDGDPLTFTWSFGDGADARGRSVTHSYGDNGTHTAILTVTDSHGASASAQVRVTIANVAPTATFGQSATSMAEGDELSLSLTEPRDVAADLPGLTYAFDCGAGYGAYGASPRATCRPGDNGTLAVRAKIRDKDGDESEYSGSVEVTNVAPTGTFGVTTPVDEGTSYTISIGDAFDPSSADRDAGFTYAFDCGDGTGYGDYGKEAAASCPTTDDAVRSVRGKIRDKDGGETEYAGTATVNNVAPGLGGISIPTDPLAVGSTVHVSAPFTDPGSADTHTGWVQWDLGQAFAGADPIAPGARTVSATSGSLAAGVYTISLRARDDDGGEDTKTASGYVVVYDPAGGFVTGGGWIWSPRGACHLAPSCAAREGKANFGFVSKYLPGASVPSGNTEFKFEAGSFRFSSKSYQWLVVAGARAQYKGEGTVNGEGRYRFLLTAIDGQVAGGGGTDRFRIKVWEVDADGGDGRIVYDNQMDAADDSDASTALGGGSIVIHTKKE
ncbi:MAG: PKD domain-containing protein [Gemmatimonadaceae bacterium]